MMMRENRGRGEKHRKKVASASKSAAFKAGHDLAMKYLRAGSALTAAGVHKRIRRSGGRQGGPALAKEKELLKSESKAAQDFRLGIQAAVGAFAAKGERPAASRKTSRSSAAKAPRKAASTPAASRAKGKTSRAKTAAKAKTPGRDSKGRFVKSKAGKTKSGKSRARHAANPARHLTPRQRQAFSRGGNVIPFRARSNPHLSAGSQFVSPLGPGEVVRPLGSSGYVVRWEDGTVENVLYPAAAALREV